MSQTQVPPTAAPAPAATPAVGTPAPAATPAAAPVAAPEPTEKPVPTVPGLGAGLDLENLDDSALDPKADPEPSLPDEGDGSADADGAASDEGDGDADDGDAEAIDYQFEAPEGVTLREGVIDAYREALQKHKVAPEVAQDLLASVLPAIQQDLDQQVGEKIAAVRAQWDQEFAEMHGEQAGDVTRRADATLAALLKAQTIRPAFIEQIRTGALASSPDFKNLLAELGRLITNDRALKNNSAAAQPPVVQDAEWAQDQVARRYEQSARG